MRVIVVLFVSVIITLTSGPAEACINEFYALERDNQLVASAEGQLRNGQNQAAFRSARTALRRLDRASNRWYDNSGAIQNLHARANDILAVSVIRLDGNLNAARTQIRRRVSGEVREANLTWALQQIEGERGMPEMDARYAEGLAALGRDAEALEIFEQLRDDDLMPDAWAFRILAQLQQRAGDAAARDNALGVCEQRAGRRARQICPEFDDSESAPVARTLS